MSAWKKEMTYLGLGPDEEYDEYDDADERDRYASRSARPAPVEEPSGTVRTVPPRASAPRDRGEPVARPVEMRPDIDSPAVTVKRTAPSAVRTVSAAGSAKPYTVRPRRFDQAQEVADRFKEGQPVIVNLQDVDRDLARRLIDFASGLCYALGGSMDKVANGVYLLTPENVSVSPEDRRLISERGHADV